MSAKEMFEKLDFECFDDREREGLPLIILYRKENKGVITKVRFDLPDKKYTTNIQNVESKNNGKLLQAINQQCRELGWLDE